MYIFREIENFFKDKIKNSASTNKNFGLILSGIVGCGKTTLIKKILNDLSDKYQIFQFTGDDIFFRKQISENSQFILNFVQSQTNQRALVFVDEVQKTEEVFDALKIAFDSGKISFIISGSNPSYLSTIAKRRLQRRADQIFMLPLGLPEIMLEKKIIENSKLNLFKDILLDCEKLSDVQIPHLSLIPEIKERCHEFFKYGGLPLSYLSETEQQKISEVRISVERGFDLISVGNNSASEMIKLELAVLNSKEFTYQSILNKTRLRRRDDVNKVIDDLMNHGYLVKKKPVLLEKNKSSYLSIFSYIDPGILTYLNGGTPTTEEKGFWLEGYVHSRIEYYVRNDHFKSEYGYYKPHKIDVNDKVKYSPGEIDFVFLKNKKIKPIEVKFNDQIGQLNLDHLKKFMSGKYKKNINFGIVIYGGVPWIDHKAQLLYWPYWLV